ncbi:MAG: ATP-binding protein [Dehalococcoidia bacterium]|nr:ATP-binding protein [Dehalococcoidia bacterium]
MRRLRDVLGYSANGEAVAHSGQPLAPVDESGQGTCQHCKGAGFVRQDVALGHPDFGRAVACRCVEQESSEARLVRLQRYSDLGPLMRLTFENLIRRGRSADPRDQARFRRCVDDAEAFANGPQGWFVLVGPSGCGKTHIAAAVANRCLARGEPALFVVVPDLLDHLRAAYRPNAEVTYDELFEQVRNAPVLILDDLGTQSATPWAQEKLFQIINHRFNARLPTVVTTTVPLEKFDERLRTRLGDPSLSQPHADPIATVHVLEERRPPAYRDLNMLELPMVREMTFETFDLLDFRSARDRDLRQDAHRHSLSYAADPQGWLVLLSDRSRDRTHLIAAIGNYRRTAGESPLLVQVADLLDYLRRALHDEGSRDYHQLKQTVRNCPLLLLDDLEIGMGSDWVRNELYQLLNPRYLARLPTVITTPNTVNRLLTDAGWERLARVLIGDPNFCSVVPVGEFGDHEERQPRRPSSRGKRAQPRQT